MREQFNLARTRAPKGKPNPKEERGGNRVGTRDRISLIHTHTHTHTHHNVPKLMNCFIKSDYYSRIQTQTSTGLSSTKAPRSRNVLERNREGVRRHDNHTVARLDEARADGLRVRKHGVTVETETLD